MKYILLLFLLSGNLIVAQSKWYEVAKSDNGNVTHFAKFEKTDKNDIHIWLRTTEADKEVKTKTGETAYEKQGYVVQYMVFHCGGRSADKLKFILYDGSGKIETEGNDKIFNEKIVPDSDGEVIYKFVCGIK